MSSYVGTVDIRPGDVFQYRFDLTSSAYVMTRNGRDTSIVSDEKQFISALVDRHQELVGYLQGSVKPLQPVPVNVTAEDICG